MAHRLHDSRIAFLNRHLNINRYLSRTIHTFLIIEKIPTLGGRDSPLCVHGRLKLNRHIPSKAVHASIALVCGLDVLPVAVKSSWPPFRASPWWLSVAHIRPRLGFTEA